MTPELEKTLIALAGKLGTTVEHLWAVMIYQARIAAIQDAILIVISLLVIWLPGRALWRYCKSDDFDGDNPVVVIGGAVYCVAALLMALVAIFAVNDFITAVLNPEYWALEQVFSARR